MTDSEKKKDEDVDEISSLLGNLSTNDSSENNNVSSGTNNAVSENDATTSVGIFPIWKRKVLICYI